MKLRIILLVAVLLLGAVPSSVQARPFGVPSVATRTSTQKNIITTWWGHFRSRLRYAMAAN
jgi:hypothetical protein